MGVVRYIPQRDLESRKVNADLIVRCLELMNEGLSGKALREELGVDMPRFRYLLARINAKRKALERRGQWINAADWITKLSDKARLAILDGLEDPAKYNPAKIGVSVAKGLGLFQADTANITNNTLIISEEGAERVLKLGAAAREPRRLAGQVERTLAAGPEGRGGAHQAGLVVVDAQCDSDVQPAVGGPGIPDSFPTVSE